MNILRTTWTSQTQIIIFNMFIVILFIVCNKLHENAEAILLIKFTLGIILVFGIGMLIAKLLHIDKYNN